MKYLKCSEKAALLMFIEHVIRERDKKLASKWYVCDSYIISLVYGEVISEDI